VPTPAPAEKKGFLPGLGANPLMGLFYKEAQNATSPVPIAMKQSESQKVFPPLIDAATMRRRKENFNQSVRRGAPKPTAKQEEFNSIVSMIKEAKAGKSASIDDVISKWKDVSRF
jgi:hypothetical protein